MSNNIDKEMYRPLPNCVTVKASEVDGLGLFATCDLASGLCLGITHVSDNRFRDGYIRTPLGGFFNHSENPNCEAFIDDDFIRLKTTREVSCGEELVARYWLYDL